MKTAALIWTWIEERFDVGELIAPLRSKTVPRHRFSIWYLLGGITLFLLFVQVLTGLLLLLYYRPSTQEAYESVQYITTRVQIRRRRRPVPLLQPARGRVARSCCHRAYVAPVAGAVIWDECALLGGESLDRCSRSSSGSGILPGFSIAGPDGMVRDSGGVA